MDDIFIIIGDLRMPVAVALVSGKNDARRD